MGNRSQGVPLSRSTLPGGPCAVQRGAAFTLTRTLTPEPCVRGSGRHSNDCSRCRRRGGPSIARRACSRSVSALAAGSSVTRPSSSTSAGNQPSPTRSRRACVSLGRRHVSVWPGPGQRRTVRVVLGPQAVPGSTAVSQQVNDRVRPPHHTPPTSHSVSPPRKVGQNRIRHTFREDGQRRSASVPQRHLDPGWMFRTGLVRCPRTFAGWGFGLAGAGGVGVGASSLVAT